jgi:hypothetical protein
MQKNIGSTQIPVFIEVVKATKTSNYNAAWCQVILDAFEI